MSGLVIKSWKADKTPIDEKGNHVMIVGREGGFFAWILSWMKVDPTTTLFVGPKRIEFSTASLAGTQSRLIPLKNVCSSYYGYHKPWKMALGIIILFSYIGATIPDEGAWPFITLSLIGLIIALVYYFLNRKLTLGFVENSGVVIGIVFKRSVIENMEINESQAKYVCNLVQEIIENK